MSKFTLLSQTEEDDLHAKRLLNIEEKPFKRVQKRLLAPTNPIQEFLRCKLVNSSNATDPSADGETSSEPAESLTTNGNCQQKTDEERETYLRELEVFTHATLHDFTSLTHTLSRLQLLLNSNARERERYAEQSEKITQQHSQIREETVKLRGRLSDAKNDLEIRKGWDTIAETVLYKDGGNRKEGIKDEERERAKTREELGRESENLRSEIEELEREGVELGNQWAERREALKSVINEADRLKRIVRGEPEHVEDVEKDEEETRSEFGEEGEQKRRDDDEHSHHGNGMLGVEDREGGASNAGTPQPRDEAPTPLPVINGADSVELSPLHVGDGDGDMTPRSTHGDDRATPTPMAGSSLKREQHIEEDEDASMHEPEPSTADLPEVKVDDAEKAEIGEMDTT